MTKYLYGIQMLCRMMFRRGKEDNAMQNIIWLAKGDPNQRLRKANVVSHGLQAMSDTKLSPFAAARILGIPRSSLGRMVRGDLSDYSLDGLSEMTGILEKRAHFLQRV